MNLDSLAGMMHFSRGGSFDDSPEWGSKGIYSGTCESENWLGGWKYVAEHSEYYYGSQSFIRGMKAFKKLKNWIVISDNPYHHEHERDGFRNWLCGWNHARLKE